MKTLGQIIAYRQADGFSKFLGKARKLAELNELFCSFLNPNLARHCQLAEIKDKEAMVMVDNAAWATRLRYASADILKNIITQPEFKNVKKICPLVSREQEGNKLCQTKNKLSSQNEELWQNALLKLNQKIKTKKT